MTMLSKDRLIVLIFQCRFRMQNVLFLCIIEDVTANNEYLLQNFDIVYN